MIGKTLSHYRIDAEIGRGGMGVVYRARDERLKRDVALKLLREEMAEQSERRTRILKEARAASALNHPSITTIYEVGESDGQLFIVMELVEGETLRRRLSSTGRVEPLALARIGAEAAEALDAAHVRGVIHGDIKPENIVQQSSGRVKLFDFGIARQIGEETATRTRSAKGFEDAPKSSTAGTVGYMAPEILRGDPSDTRSDLFSLGVTLFELAAGRRPFPGPTLNLLIAQILHEPTPRLGTAQDAIPQELARIVHKLLEKDPGSRYQSARELHVDLSNLARDLELGAVLPAAVLGKKAVAVLPFKMLTPNPEDEYLGVALADAVINHLGGSGEVLVRPTNTVRRYGKEGVDPLLAARELSVQVVVDGSIQKSGARLRVHVQAWNAADGTTLLTAKHDSEMAALFELQDKVAEELAGALGVKKAAGSDGTPEPPTKDPRAYELFLRAVERLSHVNKWDTRTAIDMLEDATRIDPRFAEAWARLAEACVFMGGTFDPKPTWYRKGELAMRRALALDPTNAHAHCAQARVLWMPAKGYKNRRALLALRESLKRNAGYHPALVWQSLIFLHVGLLEEAMEGLHTSLATHPDDGFVLTFLGQALMLQGNYDEGEAQFKRALALDPASLWANLFYPMIPLYEGKPENAADLIKRAQNFFPGDALLTSWEGLLWAKRGEPKKAERAIRKALQVRKSVLHTHHMWHTAAATYALLGRPALAVPLLTKAAKSGLPNYPVFRDDPHFRSLQDFAPYRKLLAAVKKESEGYRREFGNASLIGTR
jgi:TolB-like protein/tRNA A-37 threonylcarbamoyl transferase component Bud32/Tfp pilus assembly protein PilF